MSLALHFCIQPTLRRRLVQRAGSPHVAPHLTHRPYAVRHAVFAALCHQRKKDRRGNASMAQRRQRMPAIDPEAPLPELTCLR